MMKQWKDISKGKRDPVFSRHNPFYNVRRFYPGDVILLFLNFIHENRYEDILEKRLEKSSSVVEFLIELRDLLEKLEFSVEPEYEPSIEMYRRVIREFEDIGWDRVEAISGNKKWRNNNLWIDLRRRKSWASFIPIVFKRKLVRFPWTYRRRVEIIHISTYVGTLIFVLGFRLTYHNFRLLIM